MTPMHMIAQFAATGLMAGLMLTVLLAAVASPLIAVVSQRLAVRHSKVFYDKCARQIATMGTMIGGVLFASAAAGTTHLAIQHPDLFEGPFRLPVFICVGALALGMALSTAYTLSWTPLRGNKSLHSLLGGLASVAMLAALFLLLGLAAAMLKPGHHVAPQATTAELLLAVYTAIPDARFWFFFAQCVVGGLGAAGMFAQAYLLMRRNQDDFGRDYYKFALPYCTRWSIAPLLLQLIPASWLAFLLLRPHAAATPLADPAIWLWGAAAVLPVTASLLWLRIMRSETPLRHKASIVLAIPLVLAAAAAQATAMLHHMAR